VRAGVWVAGVDEAEKGPILFRIHGNEGGYCDVDVDADAEVEVAGRGFEKYAGVEGDIIPGVIVDMSGNDPTPPRLMKGR